MDEGRRRLWSYVSALALAALTLFAFRVFQNYGPESAVRRFHVVGFRIASYTPVNRPYSSDLVRPEDAQELGSVCTQTDGADLRLLMDRIVRPLAHAEATYQVVRIDYRTPSLVIAAVQYRWTPRSPEEALLPSSAFVVWVVELRDRVWRVNPAKTRNIMNDLSVPGTT